MESIFRPIIPAKAGNRDWFTIDHRPGGQNQDVKNLDSGLRRSERPGLQPSKKPQAAVATVGATDLAAAGSRRTTK